MNDNINMDSTNARSVNTHSQRGICGSAYRQHLWAELIIRWFSLGTPVSSTNKTDRHDVTEILLKVALSTINQSKPTLIGRNSVRRFLIAFRIAMNDNINMDSTNARSVNTHSQRGICGSAYRQHLWAELIIKNSR
jgi:hypothetical protein